MMNTPETVPLDWLEVGERALMQATRAQVSQQLVGDCGGDEAAANQLLCCLIAHLFSELLLGEPRPTHPYPWDPAKVAAAVNAKLAHHGAHWRIVRELLP